MSGIMLMQNGAVGGSSGGVIHVTVGYANPSGYIALYGYSPLQGSVAPTAWQGSTIILLEWTSYGSISFEVNGNVANSGFSTLVVAGQTFTRASASYTSGSGVTQWSWNTATNPFPSIGAVVPVTIS